VKHDMKLTILKSF